MRFIPLLLLLGTPLAQPVMAGDGKPLLQRLNEAGRIQSFHGTFVYDRLGSFSTHNVWHRVEEDGSSRERMQQIDGTDQEVLRVNGRVQCASGALADQLQGSQLWPGRELNADQLSQWYELVELGSSRVAGRSTDVLAVMPRDQYRYGFKFHLDQLTGLPLKSLLINDRGQLLERVQFTALDAVAPQPQALQPSSGCRPINMPDATVAAAAWRSDWLPPGFALNAVTQRRSPVTDESVDCLVYGDGLARFSVFLEPLRDETVEDMRAQLGPTVAVSRRMATKDGDVMVTVIGEIPIGTADRVALSMRAQEQEVLQ
ncbi:MucB/RseB C-terminal domain-containing protein [Pseudomonas sp. 5P_3.1_Bac2]|uniref:MucB/RseB C-terminal domain-containing protein n=1 Tax=Pseudomonas sp. 5P_3.1_Bac2 TaxID=2971617 RepID=UPI0021C9DA57|nr:MucB/RseB C-terminal domain-containing protein [Pseudomonas sp. 5P_3.1_Bac2]MCU1715925.1 MucB/RseB C-terminal domain-containing protein [Pseudomonas sp. 5P_3.1_Bac2]